MKLFHVLVTTALVGSLALGAAGLSAQDGDDHGVYVMLAEAVPGGFDEIVTSLEQAFEATEWQVVATYDVGIAEDDCSYRAHVLAVYNDDYAATLIQHNWLAAFALPVRLAVFEDEQGVHVTAMNPLSLNRTIVDETAVGSQSRQVLSQIQEIVSLAFPGNTTAREYGQIRSRGLIGKTMGIMAGGPFPDKIDEVASVRANGPEDLLETADRLYAGLEELSGKRKWKTRPVYRLDLADHEMVIIGVGGEPMETKAFAIVGSGGDASRKELACPGLDHAPAFPVEIVLKYEGDRVRVYLIDEMFRMKMYFEDAGKMKFAANMRMPGSIENEIRDKIEDSLF